VSRTIKKNQTGSKSFDPACRNHGTCHTSALGRVYNQRKGEYNAQEMYNEWEKPDDFNDDNWDYLLELYKCLDQESANNMRDFEVDHIEQWELEETPDSIAEDYVDLMILMLEVIEHAKKEKE